MRFLLIFLTVFLFISFSVYAQVDTVRVACIGNSITEGDGLAKMSLDNYPLQLAMLLGDSYKVFNFGKSGRTMLKKGDSPYWNESVFTEALNSEPDIVTILLGTNDSRSANRAYIDDDFYNDYQTMIDTLAQLVSNPKIYICYPPPSFTDNYTISNSTIVNKIMPNIDQLLENNPTVNFIDFYNSLLDKPHLFPDGIHPSVDGAWQMAQMIADTLAGVKVESENEVNLAKNKQVTVNGFDELFLPEGLNDGDRNTKWKYDGFDNWAIINIGEVEEFDMFQIYFGDDFIKGFQYIIDVSSDSVNWTTVVNQSARNDTVKKITVDKIDPITAQYVKIKVTGASNSEDEITSINEFKILKSAFIHSPVLTSRLHSITETRITYFLEIFPTSYAGEMIKYYQKVDDGEFIAKYGFREANVQERGTYIYPGEVHQYYTETFKDGKILISDTLTINFGNLTSLNSQSDFIQPESYKLQQNYPNPFNPETTIMFSFNKRSHAYIQIFNVLGKGVKVLGDKYYNPGDYSIVWDGRDKQGKLVASGVYYYRLRIDNLYSTANRMVFVK